MDRYLAMGISPPRGILIHGPCGVGKTSIAAALVKETGMTCIYVDSPNIRSKIVGQAETTIADLFTRARSAAPCVLLMDQVDLSSCSLNSLCLDAEAAQRPKDRTSES